MLLLVDIALGHLRRRRRQTLVSVLGVALGVGFFIAIAALMQGFQAYFISTIIDVAPHIVMKDEHRTAPLQPAQRFFAGGAVAISSVKPKDQPRGIRNGRATVKELSRLPGVAVAPSLRGQVILRYGSKDVSAALIGIDPDRERLVTNIEKDMTAGRLDDLYAVANGMILGDGLALKLGAAVGDSLSAISPAGVVLKVKLVGLFQTGVTSMDNFTGYALLKKVQVLANRPNVINEIRLRLRDITAAQDVAERIEAQYGYRTEAWQETNQNVLGIFVIQNAIMYSTTGAILVVAAFGIFNIISTVVLEKTRDIAILKSVGLEEGDIQSIFLIEGVIVGTIGAIVGSGVGYGLIRLLATVRLPIEGFVKAQGFRLSDSIWPYVIAAAAAIVAAGLAAYLPARRAARLNPVEIIRGAA